MPLQDGLDHAALNAATATVNHADLAIPGIRGGVHVVGHDASNVAGRERVEVDLGFDRNSDGVRQYRCSRSSPSPPS